MMTKNIVSGSHDVTKNARNVLAVRICVCRRRMGWGVTLGVTFILSDEQ